MKLNQILFVSLVSFASTLAACTDREAGDLDSAEQIVDSTESLESEGDMMMGALEGADVSGLAAVTGDQVAARIAANITARWSPSTCVAVTQSGSTVTVVYTDCTGPRRLAHVSGQLELVVSVAATGAITVHGTSASLRVNNADLVVDATATYTRSGTGSTVEVTSRGSGIGPRGNAIEHEGDYAITRDAATQCGTIEGHWQTELSGSAGARERSNDVSLARCATGCPTGTITHRSLRDITTTITFDGTATATWTRSSGEAGSVALSCP